MFLGHPCVVTFRAIRYILTGPLSSSLAAVMDQITCRFCHYIRAPPALLHPLVFVNIDGV